MEYYQIYIGSISVKDFIELYTLFTHPIIYVVNDLVDNWPWNDPTPDDFKDIVVNYCERVLYDGID